MLLAHKFVREEKTLTLNIKVLFDKEQSFALSIELGSMDLEEAYEELKNSAIEEIINEILLEAFIKIFEKNMNRGELVIFSPQILRNTLIRINNRIYNSFKSEKSDYSKISLTGINNFTLESFIKATESDNLGYNISKLKKIFPYSFI